MKLYGIVFKYNEPQKAQMQIMAETEEDAVNKAMANIPNPPDGLEIIQVLEIGNIQLNTEPVPIEASSVLKQAPKASRKPKETVKKEKRGPATPIVIKPSQAAPVAREEPTLMAGDRRFPEPVIERDVERVHVNIGEPK